MRSKHAFIAFLFAAALLCGAGRWWIINSRDDELPAPALLRPVANTITLVVAPQTAVLNRIGVPIHQRSPWTIPLATAGISAAIAASVLLLTSARARPDLRHRPRQEAPREPESAQAAVAPAIDRRTLLHRAAATIAIGAGWAVPVNATAIAPYRMTTRRYRIIIPDLPAGLDGFRIVQLSDTHIGPEVSEAFVAEAVRLALSLKPDLVVHTGDFLSAHPRYIEPAADVLKPLIGAGVAAPLAVLGNHDWCEGGGPPVARALERIGFRMMDNNAVFLRDDRVIVADDPGPGRGVAIVGVGDLIMSDTDVARAFARVRRDMPTILLAHEPDVAELPELSATGSPRIDVMLCGHTHGGQVRIPLLGTPIVPSAYGQKYVGGLVDGPAFPVLVSRGIGMSWLPIRWGVPPEVVELTLVAAR